MKTFSVTYIVDICSFHVSSVTVRPLAKKRNPEKKERKKKLVEGIRTKIATMRVKFGFFHGNKERKTQIVENRVTGELKNIYSFQTPSDEAICTMHVFVGYSSLIPYAAHPRGTPVAPSQYPRF